MRIWQRINLPGRPRRNMGSNSRCGSTATRPRRIEPMNAQDSDAIASFKAQWLLAAANRRGAPISIEEQRESFEEFFRSVPTADGCIVQAINSPGFSGERIVPRDAAPSRALLYFHGGGFFFGSLQTHRHLVSRFAVGAGVTAGSIDYRRAPVDSHDSDLTE